MPRPRSVKPKENTSIIKAKRKNGWSYVQKVVSVYDPKTKNSKRISTQTLGKLPPGETDLSKMIPVEPRKRKQAVDTKKIVEPAEKVADPRDPARIVYPLDITFCVILLAAMYGKQSCVEIAAFWKECRPILGKTYKDFPDKDISHDTVRRIVMIIGKDKNAKLVERFSNQLKTQLAQPVIAVDGQAVRASRNEQGRSPYVLNIMDTDNELVLTQQVIGSKENEITHAAEVISRLDIRGAIVTADALNTQEKFASQICSQAADYCLALKENQQLTYDQVRGYFELSQHSCKVARPVKEDKQGKLFTRKVRLLPGNLLPTSIQEKWKGINEGCIVQAVTETVIKKTAEILEPQVRYYLSSLRWDSDRVQEAIMRAIRQHWAIENKAHWALDVAFNQDRIQCTNGAYLAGCTLLNKIALNFTSKIQTLFEENTGKQAPSKPDLRSRLHQLDVMLSYMNACLNKVK